MHKWASISTCIDNSGVRRFGDVRSDCLIVCPLTHSSIGQWRMLVIVTGYTLLGRHNITSTSFICNPTFWRSLLTQNAYYSIHTLLFRCSTIRKTQHSTLRQSSSLLQKYPKTRWSRGVQHTQCYVNAVHNCKDMSRDGFRKRGALGHLTLEAPRRCDLFGRLSEKRESMPVLCVVPPQKSIFCCADFGAVIGLDDLRSELDLQQKLKPFLHSSKEQISLRSSLGIYDSFVQFRSSHRLPWLPAFSVSLFFGYIHFHERPCCRPRK